MDLDLAHVHLNWHVSLIFFYLQKLAWSPVHILSPGIVVTHRLSFFLYASHSSKNKTSE